MAIIKCTECRKPISDKSNCCTHCGFDSSATTPEQREQTERMTRLKANHRLDMILYASMLIFVAGVLAFYFGRQNESMPYLISGYAGLGIGGIGYLWSRIQKFVLKRQ